MSGRKMKVAYFYEPEFGDFYYGQEHPMKPHRVRMVNNLIIRYGLYRSLEVYRPKLACQEDLAMFHEEDYVEFLKHVSADDQDKYREQMRRYKFGGDCPIFDGMYRYCQMYSGASIGAAVRINYGLSDIAINWSGGLHHGKKSEASGFCYVNDIVLAILELLKYHQRVLYIDIDIHHGDGVEEAFLTTDRVMTVSFHKWGPDFFPGTGSLGDVGVGAGKYYAINVPLKDGIDDATFHELFRPIMRRVMEVYQPEVVVLQSGADSLAGDRLGAFNLSIRGHAACHRYMMGFAVPLLVLGGGGYKIKNVARCWTYETGALLGQELPEDIPPCEYHEYFGPDYLLHIPTERNKVNENSREQLEKIRNEILENLRHAHPPGVAFHERAPDMLHPEDNMLLDMLGSCSSQGAASGSRSSGNYDDDEEEEGPHCREYVGESEYLHPGRGHSQDERCSDWLLGAPMRMANSDEEDDGDIEEVKRKVEHYRGP